MKFLDKNNFSDFKVNGSLKELQLVELIEQNDELIIENPMNYVAEVLHIHQSTLTRIVRKIGFDNYRDFRNYLNALRVIKNKEKHYEKIENRINELKKIELQYKTKELDLVLMMIEKYFGFWFKDHKLQNGLENELIKLENKLLDLKESMEKENGKI